MGGGKRACHSDIHSDIHRRMKVHVKLALANGQDEEFCGAGVLELLEGIGAHGSIHRAAQEMGLSYVKALKILNRVEKELGQTLLERHKGGAERGRTELTPFARRFMRDFARLRGRVRRAADAAFKGFRETYE